MVKVIKHNYKYNVLRIEREKSYDFYLEKIGYGNLYYIVGTKENIIISRDYVVKIIENAEKENFWA